MMTQKRTIAAYAIYLFAITVFFIYTVFPEAAIRQYVGRVAEATLPKNVTLSIGQVSPAIPPEIVFKDVRLSYNNTPMLQLARLALSPGYVELAKGTPAVHFNGGLHGGNVSGAIVGLGKGPPEIRIQFSELDLAQLAVLNAAAPNRPMTGQVSGQCRISPQPDGAARIALEAVVTDATLELLVPIGSIRAIAFDTIEIKAAVAGRTITISSCVWKSPLLAGITAGTIGIQEPVGSSTIALNGTIMPQQALIQELGEPIASRLFPAYRRRKNGFQITFTGTFEKPSFDVK